MNKWVYHAQTMSIRKPHVPQEGMHSSEHIFQNLEHVMAASNLETHAFKKTDPFHIKTCLNHNKTHFFSFLHTDN